MDGIGMTPPTPNRRAQIRRKARQGFSIRDIALLTGATWAEIRDTLGIVVNRQRGRMSPVEAKRRDVYRKLLTKAR